MHNSFTVEYGSIAVKVFNTVLPYMKDAIIADERFTDYISVKGGERTLTKLAETSAINTDVMQGGLFVTRSITIEANESEGLAISQMGFCSDARGEKLVNRAELTEVLVKQNGKALVISGTIFIETENVNLNFVGGDNKLARCLLGCARRGDSRFEFARGSVNFPNMPIYRDDTALDLIRIPAEVELDSSGICFKGAFGSGAISEILLCMDGILVARCNIGDEYCQLYTYSSSPATYSSIIKIERDYPVEVFNVKRGTVQVEDFMVNRYGTSFDEAADILPTALDRDTKIVFNELAGCAAFITDREIIFVKADNGGVKILLKLKNNGYKAEVCRNGALALMGGNKVTIYDPKEYNGGDFNKLEFEGFKGEKFAILYDYFKYYFMIYDEGVASFYWYNVGSKILEKKHSAALAAPVIFGYHGSNKIIAYNSISPYGFNGTCFGVVTNNAIINIGLKKLAQAEKILEGRESLYFKSEGKDYIFLYTKYDKPIEVIPCQAIYFTSYYAFCLVENILEIFYLGRETGEIIKVGQVTVSKAISDIGAIGRWIVIIFTDGDVKILCSKNDKAYMYSADFVTTNSVSYNLYARDDVGLYDNIRVKMEFKFN